MYLPFNNEGMFIIQWLKSSIYLQLGLLLLKADQQLKKDKLKTRIKLYKLETNKHEAFWKSEDELMIEIMQLNVF